MDELFESIAKVQESIDRRSTSVNYRALYPATIIFTDGELATVEAQLGATMMTLSDCKVRREAGLKNEATEGSPCFVGWEGGDPARRFVLVGSFGGTSVKWTISASGSVVFDAPETNAKHDLVSEHEVGQSAGPLGLVPGVNVNPATSSAKGDDAAFDLELQPVDNTKPMGPLLAIVTFGRAFGSTPKAVLQVKDFITAPTSAYDVKYSTTPISISITGTFPNPTGKTVITAFIRENKP